MFCCCCRIHRAGLYLNGDGVVVSKAISKGGLTTVNVEKLVKVNREPSEEKLEVKTEEKEEEKKEKEKEDEGKTEPEPVKFASEVTTGSSRALRARVWNIVSVAVKPNSGKFDWLLQCSGL